jgi:type VI secretion system protein VasJ
VFGLIKKRALWSFAVIGKHPAVGDFIRLGTETPLVAGFSSWMEKGFSRLPVDVMGKKGFFWRFWARGPGGKLILGLVRSSEDKHGRIFPLLVMGEGKTLEALSENWDIVPFFCDKTWHELDTYSRRKISTAKDMNRHLSRIKVPSDTVRPHLERRERMMALELPRQRKRSSVMSDFMNKMNNPDGLSRLDCFSVLIDVGNPDDVLIPVVKLLTLLKSRSKNEPRTVFIGGRGNKNRMIVFKRSLHADDFNQLWSETDMEV